MALKNANPGNDARKKDKAFALLSSPLGAVYLIPFPRYLGVCLGRVAGGQDWKVSQGWEGGI